jgi:hypothetical protein
MATEHRIFLGIGTFLFVAAVVYWLGDYEEAGTTMLALSAVLAFVVGGYLLASSRRPAPAPANAQEEAGDDYLPHASIWPFWVGLGSVVLANGFALGLWAIVPGALVLAFAILGYARQSRRRD